jgi:hypothetical protein
MAPKIRHAIAKLQKNRERSSDRKPRLSDRSFVQVVTPLICRDPMIFLKAAAITVCVESNDTKSEGTTTVVLLSPEQSARNSRVLADTMKTKESV